MARIGALPGRSLIDNAPKQRRVLVFGAGDTDCGSSIAVGAVVGWRLAQAAHVRVSVVCRSNYEAVKASGFRLATLRWGPGHWRPHAVHRDAREISELPFDFVLCANKVTPDAERPYKGLAGAVGAKTTLVSLQNGIEVEAPLRNAFPENTLLSGIVYFSCRQPQPGIVTHEASIRPFLAGLAPFRRSHSGGTAPDMTGSRLRDNEAVEELVGLAPGAFRRLDDLLAERWSKQLWNGAFNPLCAIFGVDTHTLLRQRSHLVARLMAETLDVAVAAGADIDPGLPQRLVDVTLRSPPIEPSMLQDVRAGRAIEIECLSGNIWRLGTRLGVEVADLKSAYTELVRINKTLARRGPAALETKVPMESPLSMGTACA